MSREAALWLAKFIPLLTVIALAVAFSVLAKRFRPMSYTSGRGLRFFDNQGNEIRGARRTAATIVLIFMLITVLAAVIHPFITP